MSYRVLRAGFAYGLREASFELTAPGLVAIAGPNGAGKSTLLGIMAGLRHPYSGSCVYRDTEVSRWQRRDFARRVAFLPQMLRFEFPFTAEQVVLMGRTPYGGGWFESPADFELTEQAMTITDTLAFRTRDFRSLSGGERQRVILASALAQKPETLLLDEPTTYLDLKHQISMYRLLSDLGRQGMQVIAVTHDLNLALQFADHALVLDHGRLAAEGAPGDVFTPRLIRDIFEVDATLTGGRLHYEA
jgi:iron complex transport system ATP-binding protein